MVAGIVFNMASLAEGKAQLETLHIAMRLPRYLSSREFHRLAVKSDSLRVKRAADIVEEPDGAVKLIYRSAKGKYLSRHELDLTRKAWWEK